MILRFNNVEGFFANNDKTVSNNNGSAIKSKNIVWTDFTETFNRTISLETPKSIKVTLPNKLIEGHKLLTLTIGGISSESGLKDTYLLINRNENVKFVLGGKNITQNSSIDTELFNPGVNELYFYSRSGFPFDSKFDSLSFDIQNISEYKNQIKLTTIREESKKDQKSFNKSILINPDAIAVVIGNQNYTSKDIPPVKYANNDASAVKNYLIETLGYKDGNIIFESDTTKAKLEMIFGTEKNHRGMLYNYIKPERSDVFIYYSGHGSPDPQTNQAYLVPIDCNPVMMDLTAYPLDVLYGNLPKIEAKSVTVVLDACFSGGTNTGKFLVQNASPALIKINKPVIAQNNLTIFTSAKSNQVSSWYPEKQHSMFTYFFLTAVTGSADFNQDKQITYQEIYDFVADRAEGVPYYAKRLHGGRIQNPTMQAADKDAVFVKY
jgi:hypothetical protein